MHSVDAQGTVSKTATINYRGGLFFEVILRVECEQDSEKLTHIEDLKSFVTLKLWLPLPSYRNTVKYIKKGTKLTVFGATTFYRSVSFNSRKIKDITLVGGSVVPQNPKVKIITIPW